MNVPWLNSRRLLVCLFKLTHPIGIRSPLETLTMMLFPVALLSPAIYSVDIRAMEENRRVRLQVPRFAAVLIISSILLGVLGIIPVSMLPIPPSLPTRFIPPRRCLVALTTIMLVLPVPVEVRALQVIDVGLVFRRRPIMG